MSEKIYDAIYKVAKQAESNILVVWLNHAMIKGVLLDCGDSKCLNDVITLEDVVIKCVHDGEVMEKRVRWLNIPACHIQSFTFDCCMIDD